MGKFASNFKSQISRSLLRRGLTNLCMVEYGGCPHADCEHIVAALAAEERRVAPAAAQEQQHYQHQRREPRHRAYVRGRLHCTPNNRFRTLHNNGTI